MEPQFAMPTVARRRTPAVRLFLGLVIGGIATWLIVSTAGGLGRAFDAIQRMRLSFVVIAIGLAVVRLGLYAVQLTLIGRRSAPLSLAAAWGLALVVFGFGAVTPAAPAEGLVIASRELRRRGHSKRQARLTLGLSEWFAQRTFYAAAAVDLLVVVSVGRITLADSWPFVVVAVAVIAALSATAVLVRRPASAEWVVVLLGAVRIGRREPREAQKETAGALHAELMAVVGSAAARIRLATVSAGAVLCDAGILWATCHAAGFAMRPELVLLAATAGTIVSWVPLLPSGLGMVEAAIPAILHRFGAPLDDALAATIVYRSAGTLLPAIAGGLAIVGLRAGPASGRSSRR